MNRIARLCLIASLSFATYFAVAATPPPLVAGTHETDASHVTLPPTDPGLLTVRRTCAECAALSFMTTANTIYELGEAPVTAAQLKQEFALRPNGFVLVVLTADRTHVKRVRMTASADGT